MGINILVNIKPLSLFIIYNYIRITIKYGVDK